MSCTVLPLPDGESARFPMEPRPFTSSPKNALKTPISPISVDRQSSGESEPAGTFAGDSAMPVYGRIPTQGRVVLAAMLVSSIFWSTFWDGAAATSPRPVVNTTDKRRSLARQVEAMYDHAFGSYMKHAFPADELRPLSCDGRRFRERGDMDAMLGNYSMTLIDALDSLAVFGRLQDLQEAVDYISSKKIRFDLDLEVSTFEVNIRVLGGLLSGHLHAKRLLKEYKGGLLKQAKDLGSRLAAAFETPTGLPLSRINLRSGKPAKVSSTVTVAEAGSFLIEFGVLSRLTGDWTFYAMARRAILSVWYRRSSADMVGTKIDVVNGGFQDLQSTTGPGQDSFFEYLLKGYMLFNDVEMLDIFWTAYGAIEQHHSFEGFTYSVDMHRGHLFNTHLSPLSCVWASLQVLAGDAPGALRTVLYWFSLWRKHSALPEVFDVKSEAPYQLRDAPLRPELAEALFYLSLAMPDDPTIIGIAESMISALNFHSRVACGFAAFSDVTTKRFDDRMDSFFLSETLVYLYMTVAPKEIVEKALGFSLSAAVFSTEGHVFPLAELGMRTTTLFDKYFLNRPRDGSDESEASPEVAYVPSIIKDQEKLYPGVSQKPFLTCGAMTPFERIAMEQRCKTKYLLSAGYQIAKSSNGPSTCKPQDAVLQLRLVDGTADGNVLLEAEGTQSSFGPSIPVLSAALDENFDSRSQLLVEKEESEEALLQVGDSPTVVICEAGGENHDRSGSARRRNASAITGTCSTRVENALPTKEVLAADAKPPAEASVNAEPVQIRPRQSELALLSVDLDLPPGRMPAFSAGGARHMSLRKLFATRPTLLAFPPSACVDLKVPKGSPTKDPKEYYKGSVVFVARGSCLFLQKMHAAQKVHAAAVVVINSEGKNPDVQVMTCPLQDKGAGLDVNIPSVMISHEDGVKAKEIFAIHGSGNVSAMLFSAS